MPAFVEPLAASDSRSGCGGTAAVNPLEIPGWDDLVAAHPAAGFFHGSAWCRVLRDTYGHAPHYVCHLAGGRLRELLPVMEVSSLLTGRRGVALPFTDFCPPLATDDAAAAGLFSEALACGRRRGWRYLECRGGLSAWRSASPAVEFWTHTVDLTGSETARFDRMDSSVRRALRKAQRSGLQVRSENSLESVRGYYRLHCQTRRRHGLPPQPFRFFANIHRHVIAPGHGRVISVAQADRVVASAVFFHFGAQAIYKFGASDLAFQDLRPNNLLLWEAIQQYAAQGCATLHFGRTSLHNEGLRRFKLAFGAAEDRLAYGRYDFRRNAFRAAPDRAHGPLNHLLRLLPVPLLQSLGKALYRHWA